MASSKEVFCFFVSTAYISQPYLLVTDEFSGRVRTYAGSELLGTAIYNLEVVTQHLGREVEDVIWVNTKI